MRLRHSGQLLTLGLIALVTLTTGARSDWAAVAEAARGSVATVVALHPAPEGADPGTRMRLVGTGVFISPSRLVTSTYVVAGAPELLVELADGRRLPCLLIAGDKLSRLAVLEVREPVGVPVDLSRMRDPVLGEEISILGTSYGFPGKLSPGVVSGLDRSIMDEGLPSMGTGFEVSSQADPGMSGAPVLAADGAIAGFVLLSTVPEPGTTHAALDGKGLLAHNLLLPDALPAEDRTGPPIIVANPLVVCAEGGTARHAIEGLLGAGEVRWGRIGLSLAPTPQDLVAHFGLGEHRGAVVTGVAAGGPAEAAGLAAGDLLLAADGVPLRSGGALLRSVLARPDGSVSLRYLRAAAEQTAEVKLGSLTLGLEAPPQASGDGGPAWLGVLASRTSAALAKQLGLPEKSGVSLVSVAEGSPAGLAGLRAGDVLLRAGETALEGEKSLEALVGVLREAKPGTKLALEVLREGRRQTVSTSLVPSPDRYARFAAGFDADVADL